MKKLLALLLVFAMCLTLLCACKTKDSKKESDSTEENENQATEETTIDVTTLVNYYQDLTAPEVTEGNVTYKVYQAWWQEDMLVAQIYIINGMSAPIYDLFIEEMCVYNEEGQIAQSSIGPLELDPIPAGEYILETFYFGYGVDLPDAELSSLSIDFAIDFLY